MPKSTMAFRATLLIMAGNLVLLLIKGLAVRASDSLAMYSELINSITDVVASVAVVICVREGARGADAEHPFGHTRAEPIGGLVVAIFAGIMGWEVLRAPLLRFLGDAPPDLVIGPWPLPALIVTLILKAGMAWYLKDTGRLLDSPALRASAMDCRNDVAAAAVAIVGVLLGARFSLAFDAGAAVLIGGYIFYQAYQIGIENINYLMGKVPDDKMLQYIRDVASDCAGVDHVRDIKAHYVGNFIHVELTICLDRELHTDEAHNVAEAVQDAVEAHSAIDRAFVHVEPT